MIAAPPFFLLSIIRSFCKNQHLNAIYSHFDARFFCYNGQQTIEAMIHHAAVLLLQLAAAAKLCGVTAEALAAAAIKAFEEGVPL